VVALKIIQLEEDDTFEEMMIEILILQKCSDKNIVKYFGSWKKGEELFVRPIFPTGLAPPPPFHSERAVVKSLRLTFACSPLV
jgi:hypothetical protein